MLTISGTSGYATYLMITSNARWTDDTSAHYVDNPYLIAGLAWFMSLFIAYSFMMLFDHVADTLLYTYEWNRSHGHNTVEQFAPSSLVTVTNWKPQAVKGGGEGAGPAQSGIWGSLFGGWGGGGGTAEE